MNKHLKTIVFIIAPLTAVLALGAALFLWYRALVPEQDRVIIRVPFTVSSEAFSAGLEGNIVSALARHGISPNDIETEKADMPGGQINNIYNVTVPANASLTLLNLTLTRMTTDMGGEVYRGIESADGKSLTLTLGASKKPTDIIILKKSRKKRERVVKVAIVIDDLGIKDIDLAKRLCNLSEPVTLAILPFQRYTGKVIDLARDTDTHYILHMPMEPQNASVNPGKGALFASDDNATVRKKLEQAFRDVPGAEGMNNHMGSKVTESERIMETVMDILSDRKVFFLDSKTSHNTVGYKTSQKKGVRGAIISGYFDATHDREAIEKRFDALTDIALKNGVAIMLGHDHPLSVEVLERKLPEMKKLGLTFVPLRELVR